MPKRKFNLRVGKTDKLEGVIKTLPSKPYTHRAIIIGSMNDEARIVNPLSCDRWERILRKYTNLLKLLRPE